LQCHTLQQQELVLINGLVSERDVCQRDPKKQCGP
jgi:hypothetical protein